MKAGETYFDLKGKIAIATGAGRGLGRAMITACAAAGADCALIARSESQLREVAAEIEGFGRRVLVLPADLSDVSVIPALVERVVAHFGRIDILVNVAGVNVRGPAVDYPEEAWDKVMDLNLKSAFFMAQAVGKHMIARGGGGKIVNTASLTSFIGLVNMVAYCSSRGGVNQMTKALAVEWASHGICVNAVAPGYFLTELTRPVFEDPVRRQWILNRIPMGRTGEPQKDIGGVAVFLASAASDYVTGHTIPVDGGWLAS